MPKKINSCLEHLHEHDVCLDTNDIWLCEEITQKSTQKFLKNLSLCDFKKTVTLNLMTEGGDPSCGLAIYDALDRIRTNVQVVCYSEVCSIGTVLMLGSDVRICHKNTQFLIHEMTYATDTTGLIHQRSYHDQAEKIWKKCLEIYDSHLNTSLNSLKNKLQKEWYLDSEEALEIGLITEVW